MFFLKKWTGQKKEIVQVAQPLIKEAKKEAFKLDQVKLITTKQQSFLEAIDYLLSLFPESFFLNKIKVTGDVISLAGITQAPDILNKFLSRVRKEARFEKIELINIKKGDQGLEFTFEFSQYKSTRTN